MPLPRPMRKPVNSVTKIFRSRASFRRFRRHCKGELIFFHISSVQRLRDLQSSCRRIIKLGFVLICKCSVFGGDVCYFQFTFQVIRYCDLQCRLMSVDRHSRHLSIRKRIFFHCVTEFFRPCSILSCGSSVHILICKPDLSETKQNSFSCFCTVRRYCYCFRTVCRRVFRRRRAILRRNGKCKLVCF